jgi:hypothetical protein
MMAFLYSVKILAERLKTYPEEFKYGNKFSDEYGDILLLAQGKEGALWFLNDQEKETLILAIREVERKKFEDNVLLQLLDEPQEPQPKENKKGFGKATVKGEGKMVGYSYEWIDPRIHLNSTQIEYCAKYGIDPESYAKLMATTHI